MTQSQINQILSQGEGVSVEFKEARDKVPASFYETAVSFSNGKGGVILLGVDDHGEIQGIEPEYIQKMLKNISSALNSKDNVNPPLYLNLIPMEYSGKTIIVIQVPASSLVHDHAGHIYIREFECDIDIRKSRIL